MLKILLVDDSKTIRLAIRGFLEDLLGEEVTIDEATDGTEAVDYIKKGQFPDLVLTDIHMPRMNGFQAAQEIRSLGYNGPLFIQSTDDASIAYLRKHGDQTVEYLVKGDIEALKQAVKKHLKLA